METEPMDSLKNDTRNDGGAQREERKTVRRVARNSFFLFANSAFGVFVRMATVPIVARYLGLERFGIYAFITAIALTLGPAAAFGVTRMVVRELAKRNVNDREFFTTACVIQAVFCAFLMGIGIMLTYLTNWSHTTDVAVLLALAGALIMALGETHMSVTWAHERMDFSLIAGGVQKVSLLVFICLVAVFDAGFLALFWARLWAAVLYFLISAVLVYARFLKPCLCFRMDYARNIIRESLPLCVARLQQALLLRVDVFVLKWLSTPAAIGLFEVPHRLISQVQILASSVNMSVFPVLARSTDPAAREMLQKSYGQTVRFLLVTGLFLTGAMNVCAEPFMSLLFGSEFLPAVASLRVLSSVIGMLFVSTFQFSLLVALGKPRLNVLCLGIALLVNFTLDVVLIPGYGYLGASVATLIAYFVRVVVSTWLVRRERIVTLSPNIVKIAIASAVSHVALVVDVSSDIGNLVFRGTLVCIIYVGLLVAMKVLTANDIRALLGGRAGRRDISHRGPRHTMGKRPR
jgi:O-antigen/teichoic acid export membrane protein